MNLKYEIRSDIYKSMHMGIPLFNKNLLEYDLITYSEENNLLEILSLEYARAYRDKVEFYEAIEKEKVSIVKQLKKPFNIFSKNRKNLKAYKKKIDEELEFMTDELNNTKNAYLDSKKDICYIQSQIDAIHSFSDKNWKRLEELNYILHTLSEFENKSDIRYQFENLTDVYVSEFIGELKYDVTYYDEGMYFDGDSEIEAYHEKITREHEVTIKRIELLFDGKDEFQEEYDQLLGSLKDKGLTTETIFHYLFNNELVIDDDENNDAKVKSA